MTDREGSIGNTGFSIERPSASILRPGSTSGPTHLTPSGIAIPHKDSLAPVVKPPEKPKTMVGEDEVRKAQGKGELSLGGKGEKRIGGEEEKLFYTYPWKFFGRIAERVGWKEAPLIFTPIEEREEKLLKYKQINKLIISDREGDLHRGLSVISSLSREEQIIWFSYLRQSKNVNVNAILKQFIRERRITLGSFRFPSIQPKPEAPKDPNILFNTAKSWRERGGEDILSSSKKTEDFGKIAGKLEVSIASTFERFVCGVVEKTADVTESIDAWSGTMLRLIEVTDVVRYRYQKFWLNTPRSAEAIVGNLQKISQKEKTPTSTKETWDLLMRIEIPESQFFSILKLMDRHGDLSHPLALRLTTRLPEAHPFIIEQQRRVSELSKLCIGSPDQVMNRWGKLSELQKGIVSVFPLGVPSEKMGIELETWPVIVGVPLPEGCYMGVDFGGTMPEVRTKSNPDVLYYNRSFRERISNLWLWEKTTRAVSASLHIHVDVNSKNEQTKRQRHSMWTLFGTDYFDMAEKTKTSENRHTFEVRTALEGYKKGSLTEGETTVRGGVNMSRMLDFLIALKNFSGTMPDSKIDYKRVEDPLQKRFLTVLMLSDNKTTRAAAILALHSPLGLRIASRGSIYFQEFQKELSEGYEFKLDNLFLLSDQEKIKFIDELVISAREWKMGGVDKYGFSSSHFCDIIESYPWSKLTPEKRQQKLKEIVGVVDTRDYNVEATIIKNITEFGFPEEERRQYVSDLIDKEVERRGYNSSDTLEALIDQLPNLGIKEKDRWVYMKHFLQTPGGDPYFIGEICTAFSSRFPGLAIPRGERTAIALSLLKRGSVHGAFRLDIGIKLLGNIDKMGLKKGEEKQLLEILLEEMKIDGYYASSAAIEALKRIPYLQLTSEEKYNLSLRLFDGSIPSYKIDVAVSAFRAFRKMDISREKKLLFIKKLIDSIDSMENALAPMFVSFAIEDNLGGLKLTAEEQEMLLDYIRNPQKSSIHSEGRRTVAQLLVFQERPDFWSDDGKSYLKQ